MDIDCREEHESITYGRIRLGGIERLLPSEGELVMVVRDGREDRNTIAFTHCRRFTAESSLSFDTSAVSKPAEPTAPQKLPGGIALVLRLEQPLNLDESAAGDPVVTRLDRRVRSGDISLPKGTRVLGRIRRLEQHLLSPRANFVALEFFAADSPGGRVVFNARLTGPRAIPDEVSNATGEIVRGSAGLDIQDDGTGTGIGNFRMTGSKLPVSLRMIWTTQ